MAAVFEPRQQNRAFLDVVAPNDPVILNEESHLGVWVNSAALKPAGITRDTPNPQNGIIELFNPFATTGADLDFYWGEVPVELAFHGNPAGIAGPHVTMRPLSPTGTYYAVMLGGRTSDWPTPWRIRSASRRGIPGGATLHGMP